MDIQEELIGSNDHSLIVKGKRTKRQRPSSPFGTALTSSSSSSGGCGDGGGGGGDVYSSIPSPTISTETSTGTEEDEDMANCLILLAQGVCPRQAEEEVDLKIEKFGSRKFTEMAAITTCKAGFYIYECKTCNRSFPSFQALGGHRASHKKPKAAIVEEKKIVQITPSHDDDDNEEGRQRQFSKIFSPPLSSSLQMAATAKSSLQSNIKQPKLHECSICGSEFTSGQALGGHMRRHRNNTTTNPQITIDTSSTVDSHEDDKPRNILPLDLNLPAPDEEDDLQDTKLHQFTPNQQHLVFSTPALVDCHY